MVRNNEDKEEKSILSTKQIKDKGRSKCCDAELEAEPFSMPRCSDCGGVVSTVILDGS